MFNSVHAYSETLGNTNIRLYAICILIGIVIAYLQGVREGRKLGLKSSFIGYGVLIIVPISIIGARIWYVLFNLDSFSSFLEVLGFENGKFVGLQGLAIQGGVIAALISIFVYCHVSHVSIYKVLDIVAPGFLIGQICGRYGNFFNRELYGPVVENEDLFLYLIPHLITDNMYINNAYRHPVFLYESCLNLIGLIIILVARKKSKKVYSGDFMGFYLVWYGLVRIFTESLRMHSGVSEPLMLGNISVSILMSVLGIILGVTYLVLKRVIKKFNGKESYYQIKQDVKKEAIDTIIFDLDGTLLDTKSLIDHTFTYVFQKYFPTHELTQAELDSFFGPPLYDTFKRYTDDENLINEMIDAYRDWNKEHHNDYVKPFDGAKYTLKALHKKGYIVAVVSSKIKEMVRYGLEYNGLLEYVDYIIGEGEVIAKPNPEGILRVMNHYKFSKNALYVGDNASDIYAGHNADKFYKERNIDKSCKSVGVLYSLKLDDLEKSEPNYYIKDLEALLTLLGI